MQVGNARYRTAADIPDVVPVFPLKGALLLPGGQLPLNIFEPRYLSMVENALAGKRIIGMIQPKIDSETDDTAEPVDALDESLRPELSQVGCLGRITTFAETGDGRLLITLQGICRFRVQEELHCRQPYRQCRIMPFLADLEQAQDAGDIDREALLRAFRDYLEAHNLEADWESIARAGNETLVNAFSIMSPFGPAEKQALLEAPDLKTRAATLIAITEMVLAKVKDDDFGSRLQ
ncbi:MULTISPECIES: LON peptidase substrate-binding domain-containing protein [unclassified Brucella]|uniref:LON peptidase substrate-binding domain-containing protein n=1 Tax=unclassified Brucella TaxID=2632610 RepID=UPI00217D52B5|nr:MULTISPECIES: LON peptidase substrate-binding domain-containing protein [unclassified Brucella]UWF68732.1 LON peptidase substrate-binding domain-containing protein [Brucella sp. 1315]UWF71851.1 LON peptidase substrate-binding domain-containing protein [Brucella sp. 2594]